MPFSQALTVDLHQGVLSRRKKLLFQPIFQLLGSGLVFAVSRDLQLKENTRLVPRNRMGLQLSS